MEPGAQRHFRSANVGGKGSWLARLTATMFVDHVVRAKQDGRWVCFKGGVAGIAFSLANDQQRHARLVFQRDRNMGPGGNAAPAIFLGVDEFSLDELAADDLVAWTLHLRSRRNSNEADVRFVQALFVVLKL
jgi:hypothetical protein